MDNRSTIVGHHKLSQEEIDLINEIKEKGASLGSLVQHLRSLHSIDQRWVAIGATDLQTGLMALTRAVAKSELF